MEDAMSDKTWDELLWSCIAGAYNCTEDRVEGSAFCQVHKDEHAKSDYPRILREQMAAVIANAERKKNK